MLGLSVFLLVIIISNNAFSFNLNDSNDKHSVEAFHPNGTQFLIDLEGFKAKPIKRKSVFFLGNITIEKRIYKNSKGKLKVRIYRGENLIDNWKSLIFTLSGFSKKDLKDLQIEECKAKLYEKDNYKAVVLPLVETQNKGLIVIFSSENFTLKEMLNLIKKFPIKNYCLSSCPCN
ncbi:MAG: hypothetical protein OD816_001413 [Thermodesulfobacterium sp.]|uniref:Uncharacterized protein n=1 Tax=Candidatus Thermodesulfobacterium syntrophicum TaxID=3060442 RepID=A0AAE3P5V4_9BACT|nr:hypothetical protein [Candidatus Thermodesulfobacterium syntrophicum]